MSFTTAILSFAPREITISGIIGPILALYQRTRRHLRR
jgi:hypothetical protein